jgi:CheY-like chemotaxis protein
MTAEPPSKPRNPAPPPSLFSRRIALVVDDELGILDLVRGLLEDDGWVVYTAPTGQQAIRYARQAPLPRHRIEPGLRRNDAPAFTRQAPGGHRMTLRSDIRPGTAIDPYAKPSVFGLDTPHG